MQKVKIGVIGCGNVSDFYLQNCTEIFDILDVVACADLVSERAKEKAEKYGVPKACTVEELLVDPEIQIVVNLTVPAAHGTVCMNALEAGKNVYVEKPFSIIREEGKKVLDTAKSRELLVGGAPDTFLGGGLQTCQKLIADGWIGKPIAATAYMLLPGHERWHPDPEFFYKFGGGPMLDNGPYLLTALIALMGPIKRATGSASITYTERTITSEPKYGTKIKVEVPTHVAGIIDFQSGAVGNLITSYDVWHTQLPHIEVYGSEGTLAAPDPNIFDGPVFVRRAKADEWSNIPLTHGFTENSRGIGVADMAYCLVSGKRHRASGEQAYHVLDIMQGFQEASESGKHCEIRSTCIRPEPLPLNWPESEMD